MPRLPGICRECGAIYPSPLRAGSPESDPEFEVPVPCPVCGGSGAVPPGVLHRLAVVMEEADRLDGHDALQRLFELLRGAAFPPETEPGEEERRLRRARLRSRVVTLGEAGGALADALFGLTEGEVRAFVRLLRLASRSSGSVDSPDGGGWPAEAVERLLEEAYRRHGPDRADEEDDPGDAELARRRLERAGRNDPCPCGSGTKYKDCHWMGDVRETR